MCGRFALYTDPQKLAQRFKIEAPLELRPRHNIAPSQVVPIVRKEGEGRRFALCQWGLLPHWAKDRKFGYSTINARAETVVEKPAFRDAFRHRRCLYRVAGPPWQPVQTALVNCAEEPGAHGVCGSVGTMDESRRRKGGKL